MMQRLGIYPGTFDPIHKGHLSFALESVKACGLDRVVFLPENQPRSKAHVTPIEQRIQQIKAIVDAHSELDVYSLKSTQFTVTTTLPEIQNCFKDVELTLLVGSDVALSLDTWGDIDTLLKFCDIAIGMRSSHTRDEVEAVISRSRLRIDTRSVTFTIVQTSHPSLSSTAFRN